MSLSNNKTVRYLTVTALVSVMSACVATPEQPEKKPSLMDKARAEHASTQSIKKQEEQNYAQLLKILKTKSAGQDAQQAITRGDIQILGYQAGRGGLQTPGYNGQQNRCKITIMDGMGDMIFGQNHMNYRLALTQYMTRYNQIMLPYCR